MALSQDFELTGSTPAIYHKQKIELPTFWDLYERAAQAKYGESTCIISTFFYEKKLREAIGDFEVSVASTELQPRAKMRTVVDISTKDYANYGKQDQDETNIKLAKRFVGLESEGSRYKFVTTRGVDFGFGSSIGGQVMRLALTGTTKNFLGLSGLLTKEKKDKEEEEGGGVVAGFDFCYSQEEKITVPPRTRAGARHDWPPAKLRGRG